MVTQRRLCGSHAEVGKIRFASLVGLDSLADALDDRSGAFRGPARHHHSEFLTAKASADVEDADRATENLGDVAYHEIAGDVPKAIVDALESIEVDHQQRDRRQLTDRALEFFFEARLEVPSVE